MLRREFLIDAFAEPQLVKHARLIVVRRVEGKRYKEIAKECGLCDTCPTARSFSDSTSDGRMAALAISAFGCRNGWSAAGSISWTAMPRGGPRPESSPAAAGEDDDTRSCLLVRVEKVFSRNRTLAADHPKSR
jgi:hypothetical protein